MCHQMIVQICHISAVFNQNLLNFNHCICWFTYHAPAIGVYKNINVGRLDV